MPDATYYVFLFALQNPLFIMFAPLEVKEYFFPAYVPPLTGLDWERRTATKWKHTFTYELLDFTEWHDVPDMSAQDILIYPDAVYTGEKTINSDSDAITLSNFLAKLPDKSVHGTGDGGASKNSARDRLLEKYPWLTGRFEQQEKQSKPRNKRSSKQLQPDFDSDEEDLQTLLTDDMMEAYFDELRELRASWETGVDDMPEF